MPDSARKIHDIQVMICAAEGAALAGEREAVDVIGDSAAYQADWIVMPVSRVSEDFFDLSSKVAGAALQKFTNYGLGFALIGDISAQVEASSALRDFVYETNRGRHIWFLPTMEEFEARLGRLASRGA